MFRDSLFVPADSKVEILVWLDRELGRLGDQPARQRDDEFELVDHGFTPVSSAP
jgi:hypothetical protein